MRVGNIFRRLGWERVRVRRGEGRLWVYRPPDPVPTSEVGTGRDKVGTSNDDAIVPTVPTKNGEATLPTLPDNSNQQGRDSRDGRDNPALEACSYLSLPSGESDKVGTDDNVWEEID